MLDERDSELECEKIEHEALLPFEVVEEREEGRAKGSSLLAVPSPDRGEETGSGSGGVDVTHRELDEPPTLAVLALAPVANEGT